MQLLHQHVLVEAGLEARLHVVERGYLQTPTHEIVSLMNDSCLAVRSFYDMKVACRFVLQLRLFHWLERQNCEHGVGVFSFFFFCFASVWLDYSPLSQRVISETQDWLWSRVTVFKSGAALNSSQPICRCVSSRLAHALLCGVALHGCLARIFRPVCCPPSGKVNTMPSNNERPYGKWWQNSVGQLVADWLER